MAIVNSMSLMAFARENGKMQVGNFTNKDTGEQFKSCIFTKVDGTRTFVSFSSNLGELTPREIANMKNELQVVELDSGSHKLCRQGQEAWEDVAL
jgi:hypothetical protein